MKTNSGQRWKEYSQRAPRNDVQALKCEAWEKRQEIGKLEKKTRSVGKEKAQPDTVVVYLAQKEM